MANGWAGEGAVLEQIEDSINDEVTRVRNRLPQGTSLSECEECGDTIPKARQEALPGVRLCVRCQEELDAKNRTFAGYNRRGSKDSQLR